MDKKHTFGERKTSELIPYINNARTHSQEQVKQIASSITEFGFTNPVLIDENNGVIAGHGRLLAADLLKIEIVPVYVLLGLSEYQKKAYIIADNQLALNAGWDDELLNLEIEFLQDSDFDIDLLGFDEDFLEMLNSENGDFDGTHAKVGSLPIRVGKQFSQSRKLGKTHQNVLVFVRGDAKKAATACGDIEVHLEEPDDEN
ncbi:TPA: ParB/Srx family N-terminal domain-containing protein [Vibrio parahaemolyticus]